MFKEYLDFREVVSLSLEGRVITGKDYYSNNEIKELERRLINAVKNKEINAKTYITHNFFIFLFTWFDYFPKGGRIRMRPDDVKELYKKWGFIDMYFNPEKIQQESAPALPKIPWITYESTFAELMTELRRKGYIAAASDTDVLRKTAPHFTVNQDIDVLRTGLGQRRRNGGLELESMPEAAEVGEDGFSNMKAVPTSARKLINKGDEDIPE
jgi:hypothetical protein